MKSLHTFWLEMKILEGMLGLKIKKFIIGFHFVFKNAPKEIIYNFIYVCLCTCTERSGRIYTKLLKMVILVEWSETGAKWGGKWELPLLTFRTSNFLMIVDNFCDTQKKLKLFWWKTYGKLKLSEETLLYSQLWKAPSDQMHTSRPPLCQSELFWTHQSRVRPCSVMSDSLQPPDCSPPGSSVCGISQARILESVAISTSRGYSQPRDRTHDSCIACAAGGFFTTEPPGKPWTNQSTVFKNSVVYKSLHDFPPGSNFPICSTCCPEGFTEGIALWKASQHHRNCSLGCCNRTQERPPPSLWSWPSYLNSYRFISPFQIHYSN